MTTYWHMQIHQGDESFTNENVYPILESKKIIGLGDWKGGEQAIAAFKNEMKVNDIVAIKNGGKLIALVQVIGGAYTVYNDEGDISWVIHRRPIRVLDWELWNKKLPQARGTLERCVNDVETTRIIKEWHRKVNVVLMKRELIVSV